MTDTNWNDPSFSEKHFVFDVESIGLHGESFAVAYKVFDEFQTFERKCFSCYPEKARGDHVDYLWVKDNVPELPYDLDTPLEVREKFWERVQYWREEGVVFWAHHLWPVDGGIISSCIQDDPFERKWEGPTPLHEICTISEIVLGTSWPSPKSSELPKHDPRNDVKYSSRVLKQCLTKIGKGDYL